MDPVRLAQWRKERGLNQGELGDLIGKSRQTVINWERGRFALPDDIEVMLMQAESGAGKVAAKRKYITPSSHPRLYTFVRDCARYLPNDSHPNSLARKGLLGWPHCVWINANISTSARPRPEILEHDCYHQALEDAAARRKHPGVEAVRRWFTGRRLTPGVNIVEGHPWPALTFNDAVEPWEGFNCTGAPVRLGGSVTIRPPYPNGFYWSATDQMVVINEET